MINEILCQDCSLKIRAIDIIDVEYKENGDIFFTVFQKPEKAIIADLIADFENMYPNRRYINFTFVYPELQGYA